MKEYKCSKCGVDGVKLWRQYQTVADYIELMCGACALKDQNKKGPIDNDGRREDICGMTDQIGWLVPAFPTEDGTFWGYASVPHQKIEWWRSLPNRKSLVNCHKGKRLLIKDVLDGLYIAQMLWVELKMKDEVKSLGLFKILELKEKTIVLYNTDSLKIELNTGRRINIDRGHLYEAEPWRARRKNSKDIYLLYQIHYNETNKGETNQMEIEVANGKYTFITKPNDYKVMVVKEGCDEQCDIEESYSALSELLTDFVERREEINRVNDEKFELKKENEKLKEIIRVNNPNNKKDNAVEEGPDLREETDKTKAIETTEYPLTDEEKELLSTGVKVIPDLIIEKSKE